MSDADYTVDFFLQIQQTKENPKCITKTKLRETFSSFFILIKLCMNFKPKKLSLLYDKAQNLFDQFMCLSSNISSTENDVNIHIAKNAKCNYQVIDLMEV